MVLFVLMGGSPRFSRFRVFRGAEAKDARVYLFRLRIDDQIGHQNPLPFALNAQIKNFPVQSRIHASQFVNVHVLNYHPEET